jgi:solute carrier family 66, member 2
MKFDEFLKILLSFLDITVDLAFIILPCVGYVHQYFKIKRLRSSQGFSKVIPLILLVAFILRIFYWVGVKFKTAILLQCIAGVLMQMVLLHKCVELSPDKISNKSDSNYFTLKDFWNWPYYEDFFFLILFFVILVSSTSIFIGFENKYYVEFLGSFSAIVEAFLGLPQILEIYRTKRVNTVSYVMIFGWLVGDFFKFCFYVKSAAPIQLILSAVGQFSFDIIIIMQIYYYTKIYSPSNDIRYGNILEEKKSNVD